MIYLLLICLIVNYINARHDSKLILSKKQPNHFVNALLYCIVVLPLPVILFLSGVLDVKDIVLMILFLFSLRQVTFEPLLNKFRGRNLFYTSIYTSFYRKEKGVQSGSYMDKVENFFIDGFINIFSGRKWGYCCEVKAGIMTNNNYLNGKIQIVVYSLIMAICFILLSENSKALFLF